MVVACHGRSLPWPPGASSALPYFASWRRWNELLDELSPRSSAARVAVSGPSVRSNPISDILIGSASARSAFGSVIRLVDRGPPAAIELSAMKAKLSLQRTLCKQSFGKNTMQFADQATGGGDDGDAERKGASRRHSGYYVLRYIV